MQQRLIDSRLTPNAISLTGFVLNVAAAVLLWQRWFFLAGLAFIIGSIMDTLDGRYSRMSGKGTPFGAFLDSTLDRLEEGFVLTAAGAYFASKHDQVAVAAVVMAVLASLMVSYTRARAERSAWSARSGWPRARCASSSCRSGSCSPAAPGSGTSTCSRPRCTCSRCSACSRSPSASGTCARKRGSGADGLTRPAAPVPPAPARSLGRGARERIMRTARELFADPGINATGIAEIVSHARVSRRTLYQHFASKDDLIVAYLRGLAADPAAVPQRLLTREDLTPRARLLEMFGALGEGPGPLRGDPFVAAAVELADPAHPGRRVIARRRRAARRAARRGLPRGRGAPARAAGAAAAGALRRRRRGRGRGERLLARGRRDRDRPGAAGGGTRLNARPTPAAAQRRPMNRSADGPGDSAGPTTFWVAISRHGGLSAADLLGGTAVDVALGAVREHQLERERRPEQRAGPRRQTTIGVDHRLPSVREARATVTATRSITHASSLGDGPGVGHDSVAAAVSSRASPHVGPVAHKGRRPAAR